MVCHRWTLALILIFVPILVTVISAFRVSLPGRAHEVKSERRHKCEDCDVSDLNLDPVVRSFKKESAKRSFDDIKKVFSYKRHAFDAKFTKKDDIHKDFEDQNDDKDDSDSVKASFERLEKVETKNKLDTKSKTKKVSVILDFNDDDDDDDDSEVEDDDDYDFPKLSDHKKPVMVDTIKKIDEQRSTTSVKTSVKPIEETNKIKDDDKKDISTTQIKQKMDMSTIKTVIKESLKSKVEIEKPVKITPKVETEIKIDSKKLIKQGIKDSDVQKIKIISKPKDISAKDPTVSEPKEKTVKIGEEKGKTKQKSTETKEPVQKSKEQIVGDILKLKNIPESKKTIEPTSEKKVDADTKTTKSESKESHSHQISDVLHRRNLLHSEFEDFYAFLPTFAPNFSRVHNPECRRHGQILLRQLRGSKLWALNMLDATAKIPSGLLQGNGIQLGDFDQCLGIRARVQLDTGSVVRIQGKYCLAMVDLKAEHPSMEAPVHLAQSRNLFKSRIDDPGHFVPRFSTLSWGVCVPSPCTPGDVEVILRDAVKHYQYKTGLSIRVKVDEHDCYSRKGANWWKEWLDLPTILTLSLYATVLTLVLIATLQDFLSTNNSEEETSDEGKSEVQEKEQKEEKEEKKKKASDGFLSSFSLYNTLGKLVAPASSGEIVCIHGVRAIATMALLVAHKFLPIGLTPYTNRLRISEIVSSPLLSWCRAGWMFTDCFLLISGTLTSYRKSTSDTMASKLLSRYFRLTPALLAVVLFYAYIWDNISSGPMWGTLVTRNAEVCRDGWWWNLLYVQNYFGFEDMCAPQTHHMAVDFQLTVVGGILVWAIQSDVPFSSTVMHLLHLLAAYSRYTTFRDHRLTALAYQGVSVSQLYRTGRLSYTSILHRCSAYLIGVSLGLALRKTSSISKLLSFFGWFICGTLWGLVLWAGSDSGYFEYRYDVTFAAIYATLAPLATALGFAWMIYAVHKNSSGILSLVLCSRPLLFISRISYALYLVQFVVYLTNTATTRSSKEFSLATLIDVQEVLVILFSSIFLTITLVIPLQSLPKISFEAKADTVEANETEKEDVEQKNKIENDTKPEKEQVIREASQRRSFMAHREILEEIPEVDVEYETQRDSNETLEEILEEEYELEDEMEEKQDEEDLEIIEEEQEEDEEGQEGNELLSRSFSGDNEQDIDEWEWTADGNDRGSQLYRYSR